MKIAFGYPFGQIIEPFHNSMIAMLIRELNSPEDMRLLGSIFPQGGCYVGMNRNKIIHRFLSPPCTDDYLLMVDTDIEFPDNILYSFKELIDNEPSAEIIAGRANIGTNCPVFYRKSKFGLLEQQVQPFRGLQEFDKVGSGIILISRHALMEIYKIAWSNFFTHLIVPSKDENGLEIPRELGDDFSFCERASAAGIRIYGSWEIFGQHYKLQPIRSNYPENMENVLVK